MLTRVAWGVVVVLSVGLFIVSVPFNFAASHAICTTASCSTGNQLTLDQVHELQHLGLSIDFCATFSSVLTILFEFCYVAIGAVIFWRKSDERVALVTSLYLVTFGAAFQGFTVLPLQPGLRVLSLAMAFVGNTCAAFFFLLLIPLSIGIAMLRSRLFDIDVIINRTLVYGSLTVLLVGLYVGLILALQTLVGSATGSLSQSPLVIVASTLVIARLIQPLRRRLQIIIDHRFYRRKFDAAKVMAAFHSTLRNEVDMDQLREQLIAVVQETMQPSHLSLWVRQPGWTETPSQGWQYSPRRSRRT